MLTAVRKPDSGHSAGTAASRPCPVPPSADAQDQRANAVRLIQPRLLGLADAAVYLGIGPDLVKGLIESGALRPVRVPRPTTLREHKRGAASPTIRRTLLDTRDLDRLVDEWRGA